MISNRTGKGLPVTMQSMQMIGCLLVGGTAGILFGGPINVNPAVQNQVGGSATEASNGGVQTGCKGVGEASIGWS